MRVLHILGAIERSGAEAMLLAAVPLFEAEGVQSELLSTGEVIGERAPAFKALGVMVRHIPFAKSPRFFARLSRLVRDAECDVVHLHTERAALWVELVARMAGAPLVVRSVHGYFTPTGWLRARRIVGRWLASHVLGVRHIYVSQSVEDNERSVLHGDGLLVPNGIDVDAFMPARSRDDVRKVREEFGIPVSAVALVSVGSCTEVKQHGDVIRALAQLSREEANVRYLHVGDGPLLREEQRLAGELGVQDLTIFASARDDVSRILGACDILIMPSRREALGMSALEASACGLPIVAYDVPGLRDVVEHEVTGLLVEPTVKALADGVARLASTPATRMHYGAAGRKKMVREYALAQWVSQHVALYSGEQPPPAAMREEAERCL